MLGIFRFAFTSLLVLASFSTESSFAQSLSCESLFNPSKREDAPEKILGDLFDRQASPVSPDSTSFELKLVSSIKSRGSIKTDTRLQQNRTATSDDIEFKLVRSSSDASSSHLAVASGRYDLVFESPHFPSSKDFSHQLVLPTDIDHRSQLVVVGGQILLFSIDTATRATVVTAIEVSESAKRITPKILPAFSSRSVSQLGSIVAIGDYAFELRRGTFHAYRLTNSGLQTIRLHYSDQLYREREANLYSATVQPDGSIVFIVSTPTEIQLYRLRSH